MKLLILCGTHGGHTVRIADRLVDVALAQEHRVQVMDCWPPAQGDKLYDNRGEHQGQPWRHGELRGFENKMLLA